MREEGQRLYEEAKGRRRMMLSDEIRCALRVIVGEAEGVEAKCGRRVLVRR